MAKKQKHLVEQHLENMSAKVLEQYQAVVREYVKGRRGVYALYRGARLYYVGLASNLRGRLRAHLKDRHAGVWDRFSLYLTDDGAHLRELEALVLRITLPKGNRSKTKFARSKDLRGYFRRMIASQQRQELNALFEADHEERPLLRKTKGRGRGTKSKLKDVIPGRVSLRRLYKGKMFRATVRNGMVRFKGVWYPSPSKAAWMVVRRPVNGWGFWRYERSPGVWVALDELRRDRR